MGAALSFLERYHKESDNFLDQLLVVAGYETWLSHIIPESKRQSVEWHHSHSPSNPIKFKQTLSTRKALRIHSSLGGGGGETGKASFWWNSCPKAKPLTLRHIVQL
jgi:hypothetical protein